MLNARVLYSTFLFLASAQGQTGAPTDIMSILPIFTSGSVIASTPITSTPSSGVVSLSSGSSTLPTSTSASLLPSLLPSFLPSSSDSGTSGSLSIPAGETPISTPSSNVTLTTVPPTTAIVTETTGGASSTPAPSSSGSAPPQNSAAEKVYGQSVVFAAAMAVLGSSWAALL